MNEIEERETYYEGGRPEFGRDYEGEGVESDRRLQEGRRTQKGLEKQLKEEINFLKTHLSLFKISKHQIQEEDGTDNPHSQYGTPYDSRSGNFSSGRGMEGENYYEGYEEDEDAEFEVYLKKKKVDNQGQSREYSIINDNFGSPRKMVRLEDLQKRKIQESNSNSKNHSFRSVDDEDITLMEPSPSKRRENESPQSEQYLQNEERATKVGSTKGLLSPMEVLMFQKTILSFEIRRLHKVLAAMTSKLSQYESNKRTLQSPEKSQSVNKNQKKLTPLSQKRQSSNKLNLEEDAALYSTNHLLRESTQMLQSQYSAIRTLGKYYRPINLQKFSFFSLKFFEIFIC